jgi:hypothetical protein
VRTATCASVAAVPAATAASTRGPTPAARVRRPSRPRPPAAPRTGPAPRRRPPGCGSPPRPTGAARASRAARASAATAPSAASAAAVQAYGPTRPRPRTPAARRPARCRASTTAARRCPVGSASGATQFRQRVDGVVEHRRWRRRGRRTEAQQLAVEHAEVVQRGVRGSRSPVAAVSRHGSGRAGLATPRDGPPGLRSEQLHEHRYEVGDRDVHGHGDVGAGRPGGAR